MVSWDDKTSEEKVSEFDKILKGYDHKHAIELNDLLDRFDEIIDNSTVKE